MLDLEEANLGVKTTCEPWSNTASDTGMTDSSAAKDMQMYVPFLQFKVKIYLDTIAQLALEEYKK